MSEADHQYTIFAWRDLQLTRYPELALMFATLNGIKMSPGMAKKAKCMGQLNKGLPDIFLLVRRGSFCGLAIELKDAGGKATPEQADWLQALRDQGYWAKLCWGCDDAIRTIEAYMALEKVVMYKEERK
jgi:hypothetical protein